MSKLTHVDNRGRVRMVDVSGKSVSDRYAEATGSIRLLAKTIALIKGGTLLKGNVITTAELAGIQAAKRTSELIPLCHNIALTNVHVRAELTAHGVAVTAKVKSIGRTGAEVEALVAVSMALLTVYDMCKAVDHSMEITAIHLVKKTKKEA